MIYEASIINFANCIVKLSEYDFQGITYQTLINIIGLKKVGMFKTS
jgi:hypothetical protein